MQRQRRQSCPAQPEQKQPSRNGPPRDVAKDGPGAPERQCHRSGGRIPFVMTVGPHGAAVVHRASLGKKKGEQNRGDRETEREKVGGRRHADRISALQRNAKRTAERIKTAPAFVSAVVVANQKKVISWPRRRISQPSSGAPFPIGRCRTQAALSERAFAGAP